MIKAFTMKYLITSLLGLGLLIQCWGAPVKGIKQNKKTMKVAIFLYDGVEILDFSGPAEVFAVSGYQSDGKYRRAFEVYTVAVTKEAVTSQGFLKILPDYSLDNAPMPDILVLPGGSTGKSRKNNKLLEWIKEVDKESGILMSVCTGAFLLGDSGLLDKRKATTWYGAIERLKHAFPEAEVLKDTRYVEDGNIVTTAGVSAGIDGALHVVSRLVGQSSALNTAEYMEYDKWVPEDGVIVSK